MAIPTAEQLLTLMTAHKSFLTPAGADDIHADGWVSTPHLVNLLTGNYGLTVNPVAAPQIPAPFTAQQILGSVSSANRAKAMSSAAIVGIQNSITAGDRVAIANWAQLCVDASVITTQEQAAINTLLPATVPDPNWPTHVSLLEGDGYSWDDTLPATIDAALGRVTA